MVFEWAAMTKQRRLPVGAKSNVEAMNTDIYCDVRIIIFVCRDCITPVLIHAIKSVNVDLCKSADLVWLGSNA